MRAFLIRLFETLNSLGFALIVGGVVYVIIGSVTSVVHGDMMRWNFCETAHYLLDTDWCSFEPHTDEAWFNQLGHRMMTVPLYMFMFFWGFLLVAVCSALLKALGFRAPWKSQ